MTVHYDRSSGKFGLPAAEASSADIGKCEILNDSLREVREWLSLKRRAGKFSHGFLVEMAVQSCDRRFDAFKIFDEIGILEGYNPGPSLTKKAERLRGPLKGLWHKHYLQAQYLPRNLFNEAERMWRDGSWEKMFASHYGKEIGEFIDQVTHQIVDGAYQQRAKTQRMTGEFIVFETRQDGSNYYLTLGMHGEWDAIRKRVIEYKGFDVDGGW